MAREKVLSYPKPHDTGGRLIREVIQFLKRQNVELPISSHILIAVSGGPDSMALAHLLIKYGRRVVDRDKISILHIDHGWRKTSAADARFVRKFGQTWGVPVLIKKLKSPIENAAYRGRSWEEVAREARKAIFEEYASKKNAVVLTAHQADDLAETLLWRLFSGAATTHGGGIAFRHGVEIRPFLTQRKSVLFDYLREEKQAYVEDETNLDPRFLRARIRQEIMPAVEKHFPMAVDHLVKLGLAAQASASSEDFAGDKAGPEILFQATGIRRRRAYFDALARGQTAIDLPGGWKLTRQSERVDEAPHKVRERWILER